MTLLLRLGFASEGGRSWKQRLGDLRLELLWARKRTVTALTDEKRIRELLRREAELAGAWRRRAELALRAGNERLAQTAESEWSTHATLADDLRDQAEKLRALAAALKDSMQQLREEIALFEDELSPSS